MLDKIVLRGTLENSNNPYEVSTIMNKLFHQSTDHIIDICNRKHARVEILDFELKTIFKMNLIELTVFIEINNLPNVRISFN